MQTIKDSEAEPIDAPSEKGDDTRIRKPKSWGRMVSPLAGDPTDACQRACSMQGEQVKKGALLLKLKGFSGM